MDAALKGDESGLDDEEVVYEVLRRLAQARADALANADDSLGVPPNDELEATWQEADRVIQVSGGPYETPGGDSVAVQVVQANHRRSGECR